MTAPAFSFDALESRLEAIPDGPASVFDSPRWLLPFYFVGWTGALVGLLPSALIRFMDPAPWMVWMARAGLWIELAGFAPGLVRGGIVLGISFWHWRREQVRQLDHDLPRFRELRDWLCQFPIDSRREALSFVRRNRERLGTKLGLLAGSLDKLGVLPILVAVAIQWKASSVELGAIPLWQALTAFFLLLMYAIGIMISLMRLRLQLYEMVLSDSLETGGVQVQQVRF